MRINLNRFIVAALSVLAIALPAMAQTPESANYRLEENYIGPGGFIQGQSGNYSARGSLGDTGIGNSSSANYQIYAGYTTTRDEFLEMVVTGSTINMGTLSTSTTATGTGTFYVRSYLASGYVVATVGDPPTNENGDTIAPMAIAAAASAGTEQFGINLVANTSPVSFGANPVQVPDSSFSFGYAAAGYDTANQYKYVKGDVIAKADSSSGRTDYTISYIMNIAPLTEAGFYTMNHDLVATATF